MADLLEATEDRIVRKISGVDRTFLCLTAYDRADLLRADLTKRQESRVARKQKLIENLKLAGITGEQMFTELEAFDGEYPETASEQDWITFVNDPLNEVSILVRSLNTYGPEAESIAKKTAITLTDKATLCGLSVMTRSETTAPNPQTAPTCYETTAPETSTGEKPTVS
jgi:hypothetical protein